MSLTTTHKYQYIYNSKSALFLFSRLIRYWLCGFFWISLSSVIFLGVRVELRRLPQYGMFCADYGQFGVPNLVLSIGDSVRIYFILSSKWKVSIWMSSRRIYTRIQWPVVIEFPNYELLIVCILGTIVLESRYVCMYDAVDDWSNIWENDKIRRLKCMTLLLTHPWIIFIKDLTNVFTTFCSNSNHENKQGIFY